jgi:copper chaperone CopZ
VPQIKRAWRADPATNDYNLPKNKKAITKVEAVQELQSPVASQSVSVNWQKNKRKVKLITSAIASVFFLAVSILFIKVYGSSVKDDGVDPFVRALSLDMQNLIYLDDKPKTYQVGSHY